MQKKSFSSVPTPHLIHFFIYFFAFHFDEFFPCEIYAELRRRVKSVCVCVQVERKWKFLLLLLCIKKHFNVFKLTEECNNEISI